MQALSSISFASLKETSKSGLLSQYVLKEVLGGNFVVAAEYKFCKMSAADFLLYGGRQCL